MRRRGALQTTTDDRRLQMPEIKTTLAHPPALCVGGPVIIMVDTLYHNLERPFVV